MKKKRLHYEQGDLPSCQTLAAIGAIGTVDDGIEQLESMIEKLPSGDYSVTFPKSAGRSIMVKAEELKDDVGVSMASLQLNQAIAILRDVLSGEMTWLLPLARAGHVRGDLTPRVLELAYARYLRTMEPSKYASISEDRILRLYRNSAFHYRSSVSLEDFTGWQSETIIASGGTIPEESLSFEEEEKHHPGVIDRLVALFSEFAENPGTYAVVACTVGTSGTRRFLDAGSKILPWHDHTVTKIIPTERVLGVCDPYNSSIEMLMEYETFFRYFNLVSFASRDYRKLL